MFLPSATLLRTGEPPHWFMSCGPTLDLPGLGRGGWRIGGDARRHLLDAGFLAGCWARTTAAGDAREEAGGNNA